LSLLIIHQRRQIRLEAALFIILTSTRDSEMESKIGLRRGTGGMDREENSPGRLHSALPDGGFFRLSIDFQAATRCAASNGHAPRVPERAKGISSAVP